MDIGVIYQNDNVYISCIDNVTTGYNGEVTGVLTLAEHTTKRPGREDLNERLINWQPSLECNKAEKLPFEVRSLQLNIEEIKAFKRAKMNVGNCHSYMVFFTRDGSASPMLIFRDGGTKNFMEKMENYVCVTKSDKERFLFLVEPRQQDAVYTSFDSLGMFSHTKEAQANKFSRPKTQGVQKRSQLWSEIVNIGAQISNQLTRNIVFDPESSYIRDLLREDAFGIPIDAPRLNTREDNDTGFEVVTKIRIKLPTRSPVQRRSKLSELEWRNHLSPDGTVTCVDQLKEKIFKGGVEMSLRPVVWPYLLGYYKWDFSLAQNKAIAEAQKKTYDKLKQQWQNIFPEQEERFTSFRCLKRLVLEDMLRTDRGIDFYTDEDGNLRLLYNILLSYSLYNFDLGYVQGMNDLLAPILYLVHDEVDSFGCFVNLMETLESNFTKGQLGITKQFRQLYILLQIFDQDLAEYLDSVGCRDMIFCFQWFLVIFKRELSYENTMLLWEVLWTNYRCNHFHLLFALAILLTEKHRIIESKYGLSEILKHVNDLRLNEDIHVYLCYAESLYLQLEQVWSEIPDEMKEVLDIRISGQSYPTAPPESSFNSNRVSRDSQELHSDGKSNYFSLLDFPNSGDTSSH